MSKTKEESRIEKKRARWKKTLGSAEKSQPGLDTASPRQAILKLLKKEDKCAKANLSLSPQQVVTSIDAQSTSTMIKKEREKSPVNEPKNTSKKLQAGDKGSLLTATAISTTDESDDDDIMEIQLDPYSCRRTSIYIRNSKNYENQLLTANPVSEIVDKNSTCNSPRNGKRKDPCNSESTVMKKMKTIAETQPVKSELNVNPVDPAILSTLVNLRMPVFKKCFVCIDKLEDSDNPFVIRWVKRNMNYSASSSDVSSSPNNDILPEKRTKFDSEDGAGTTDDFAVNFSEGSPKLDDKSTSGKFTEVLTSTPTLVHQDIKNISKPKEILDEQKVLEKMDSRDVLDADKDQTSDKIEALISEASENDQDSQEDEISQEDTNSDGDLYSPDSQESEYTEETLDTSESEESDNYITPDSSDSKESDDKYETPDSSISKDIVDSEDNSEATDIEYPSKNNKTDSILLDSPSVVLIRLESITKNYVNIPAREMEQMTDEYVKTHMSDNLSYLSSFWNSRVLSEDSSSLGELCIDESNDSELINNEEDNSDDDHEAVRSNAIQEDKQKNSDKMDVLQIDETQQQEDTVIEPSKNKEKDIPNIPEEESITDSNSQNVVSSDLEYLEHVSNNVTNKSAVDSDTNADKNIEVITLDDSPVVSLNSQNVEKSASSTSVSKSKSPVSKKKDADSEFRKTLVCIFCYEDFRSLSKIKLHMENKHPKLYKNKTLMARHGYDFDGSNECSICKMKFETKEALFDHLCKHTTTEYQEAYKTNAEARNAKRGEWFLNETINNVPEAAKENEIQDNGQIVLTKPKKISSEIKPGESDSVLSPNNPRTTPKPASTDMSFTAASLKICGCHEYETTVMNLSEIHIEILLSCTICNTHFRRRDCMELHYRSSASCSNNRTGRSIKVLCSVCRCFFDEVPNLRQHIQNHLTRNAEQKFAYVCDICQVVFYGSSIQFYNHWSSHIKDPQFICSKFSFPKHSIISADQTDLTKETRLLRRDYLVVAEYTCKKCGKSFQSTMDLDNHHSNEKNDCRPDTAVKDLNPLLIRCNPCWKTFNRKQEYVAHRNFSKHLPYREPLYRCVPVTPTDQLLVCNVCQNMNRSMDELKEHFLKHNRVREYFHCLICQDLPETSITDIEDHFKRMHKTQSLQCWVNYLQAKFFCTTCNLGFDTYQAQQDHNKTHAVVKPLASSTRAVITKSQVHPTSTLAGLTKSPNSAPAIVADKSKPAETQDNLDDAAASGLKTVKVTGAKNDAGFSLVGKTVKLVAKNAAPKNIAPKPQKATAGKPAMLQVSTLQNIATPSVSGLSKLTTVQNISTSGSKTIINPTSSIPVLANPITPSINPEYQIYMLPPLTKAKTSIVESPSVTTVAITTSVSTATPSTAPIASSVKPGTSSQTTFLSIAPISSDCTVTITPAGTVIQLEAVNDSTGNQSVPAVGVSLESITKKMNILGKKIMDEMRTRIENSGQSLPGKPAAQKRKLRDHLMTLLKDARAEIMKDVSISEISGEKKKIDQLIQDQIKPFFHDVEGKLCKMINSKVTANSELPDLGSDEDTIQSAGEPNETIRINPGVPNDSVSEKPTVQLEDPVTTQNDRPGNSTNHCDKDYNENDGSPEDGGLIIDESVDPNEISAVSDKTEQQSILSTLLGHEVSTLTSQNQAPEAPSQIVPTPLPVVSSSTPVQQNEAPNTADQFSLDEFIQDIIQEQLAHRPQTINEVISKAVSLDIQSSEQTTNQDTIKPLLRVKNISELTAKVQTPKASAHIVPHTSHDGSQIPSSNVQRNSPSQMVQNFQGSPMAANVQMNSSSQMTQNLQGSPMVSNMQRNSPSQMTQNLQGSPMVSNMQRNSPSQMTQNIQGSPMVSNMQRNSPSQMTQNIQGNPMVSNMQRNLSSQMAQNLQGNPMASNVQRNSPNQAGMAQTNSSMMNSPQANVSLNCLPSNITMGNNRSFSRNRSNASTVAKVNPFQNNYPARTITTSGVQRFQPVYRQNCPPTPNPSNNYPMMQANLNPRMATPMMQQMQPMPGMSNLAPRPVMQQGVEARMRAGNPMMQAMNYAPQAVRPPPPVYNSARTTSHVNASCYANPQCPTDHAYSRPNVEPAPTTSHANVNAYSCSNCKNFASFNLEEVQQHMITQCQFSTFNNNAVRPKPIFECMFCRRYRTEDAIKLDQHKLQCHLKNNANMPNADMSEIVFICKYCPTPSTVIFKSVAVLNDHLYQRHNILRQ